MPTIASTGSFVWITTADESVDHALSDDAMTDGLTTGLGEYSALCGARFRPAALVSPPAPLCARCAAIQRQQATLARLVRHQRQRRSWPKAGRHRAR